MRRVRGARLHEVVAAGIRGAIADGDVWPGEPLPLARDLAAVMGVDTVTVRRALRLLREDGLVIQRRGRWRAAVGHPEANAVFERVRELVVDGRRHGYQKRDLIAMIEAVR